MAVAAWVETDTRKVPASHIATAEIIYKNLEIQTIVSQTIPVCEKPPVIAGMTVGTAASRCLPCRLRWGLCQCSPSVSFTTLVQLYGRVRHFLV